MQTQTLNHSDPITFVLVAVTSLYFCAILGRYLAKRLKQPSVLGELLVGVFVGNVFYYYGLPLILILREGSSIFEIAQKLLQGEPLSQSVFSVIENSENAQSILQALQGPHGADYLKIAYVLDSLARYGLIFLLFMAGLESSVSEMKRCGRDALGVALIGVVAPLILGFLVSSYLLPQAAYSTHLFIGATLSATSVGISARVLTELEKLRTREAQTILGAAMLDDLFGLMILAVVSSIVVQGSVDFRILGLIMLSSALFFVGVLWLGPIVLRRSIPFFQFLQPWEAIFFVTFLFIMFLSWLAASLQLATIIGAFTAGLILNNDYFSSLNEQEKKKPSENTRNHIETLLAPLEFLLAPLFFVLIGIQVKLESFYDKQVIFLALALIVVAILGKLVSGLGVKAKIDRLVIGIGMLPRGEVGLVFAAMGQTLGVISSQLFSAIVLMVIVTTLITPPLLKARFQ